MARTWKAGAIRKGLDDGDGAAGWWIQENGGGRDTRPAKDLAAMAERVLQGLDDGDPEILDGIPAPDLSGQWADGLTPRGLLDWIGADPDSTRAAEAESDLCDAYEAAFSRAATDAITKHLRGLVRAAA